jgi:hypothetical protein
MIKKRNAIFVYLTIVFLFVVIQTVLFMRAGEEEEDNEPLFDTENSIKINPDRHAIVFFHIQKTRGTYFDQAILENLQYYSASQKIWKKACHDVMVRVPSKTSRSRLTKKFECKRWTGKNESWYFSEHINGWGWKCGLHPDLTDLRSCMEKEEFPPFSNGTPSKDFRYISILRNPMTRFLSEFHHIKKTNSTWVFEFEPKTEGQNCSRSIFLSLAF